MYGDSILFRLMTMTVFRNNIGRIQVMIETMWNKIVSADDVLL